MTLQLPLWTDAITNRSKDYSDVESPSAFISLKALKRTDKYPTRIYKQRHVTLRSSEDSEYSTRAVYKKV